MAAEQAALIMEACDDQTAAVLLALAEAGDFNTALGTANHHIQLG